MSNRHLQPQIIPVGYAQDERDVYLFQNSDLTLSGQTFYAENGQLTHQLVTNGSITFSIAGRETSTPIQSANGSWIIDSAQLANVKSGTHGKLTIHYEFCGNSSIWIKVVDTTPPTGKVKPVLLKKGHQ
ncbi:hypothetical protein [Vagococcus silagei]|uniref:Uncharacterized protein n=1 Tax=Vagococcus silagei TaxID=2508885 RepID=A0A4V3TV38_9ENTE|nr:hypothetical protein [Vagococcus silagei]THB61369.1 hypothetical protein ESZ54_05435 [Vagococcus silagei]